MPFTKKAPWSEKIMSDQSMRFSILESTREKKCWQVKNYFGSMLHMDFGKRISLPGVREKNIIQGEAILGIRDCFWSLYFGKKFIIDSDSIDEVNAERALKVLIDKNLVDISRSSNLTMDFIFSHDISLSIDITNRYNADDDIAEFIAPDGKIYAIQSNGTSILQDEVSVVRFTN